MPKGRGRKNSELPIISGDPKISNEVQKSRPLFSLWKSDLTLSEFKILDTYLSLINSHDPESRYVRFEKGKIEKLLGVTQIKPQDLKLRLRHLMERVIEITDKRKGDDISLISLFSIARCIKNKDGLWQVDIACTPEAMEYFFNIEELGYFRYKLRSVINLNSRYSYLMFIYLENNRFRKEWTVDLSELKQILNCENDETYSEYKHFNNLILKRCYKELNEKTELQFTYSPIRNGRNVAAIRFNIAELKNIDFHEELLIADDSENNAVTEDDQIRENSVNEKPSGTYAEASAQPDDIFSQRMEFFSACFDDTFNELEVQLILSSINPDMVEYSSYGPDVAKYNYLDRMYKRLLFEEKERDIKNRFKYFVSMIRNDKENIV
ncbi:MAG: replication initiation protein [Lachnospiraceae bacterium]|nr:replication initiation protein [Lachnospiraceae bacterium]